MSSVNIVMLVGNIGRDPELSHAKNGKEICKFSIATSRWDKKTDWHNIVCFGGVARAVSEYCRKGNRVHVQGEIQYSEYEKDGVKKHYTNIIAREVTFLFDKKHNQAVQSESVDVPGGTDDNLPF